MSEPASMHNKRKRTVILRPRPPSVAGKKRGREPDTVEKPEVEIETLLEYRPADRALQQQQYQQQAPPFIPNAGYAISPSFIGTYPKRAKSLERTMSSKHSTPALEKTAVLEAALRSAFTRKLSDASDDGDYSSGVPSYSDIFAGSGKGGDVDIDIERDSDAGVPSSASSLTMPPPLTVQSSRSRLSRFSTTKKICVAALCVFTVFFFAAARYCGDAADAVGDEGVATELEVSEMRLVELEGLVKMSTAQLKDRGRLEGVLEEVVVETRESRKLLDEMKASRTPALLRFSLFFLHPTGDYRSITSSNLATKLERLGAAHKKLHQCISHEKEPTRQPWTSSSKIELLAAAVELEVAARRAFDNAAVGVGRILTAVYT